MIRQTGRCQHIGCKAEHVPLIEIKGKDGASIWICEKCLENLRRILDDE